MPEDLVRPTNIVPPGMTDASETNEPPRIVMTRGEVDNDAVEYAHKRLGAVIESIGEPVLLARIKLTVAPDPAREHPAHAQVTVDIDGDVVRAHVAATAMHEAIDLLRDRVRDQLRHRAARRQARHRSNGTSATHEWRRGDVPTHRPDHFDRPREERELVRHKTLAIGEMTADEAAFDMEQLDFDFYLFRDLAGDGDAILQREPAGGYRLSRLDPDVIDDGPTAIALTVDERIPPTLELSDAIEILDTAHVPFVFFADAGTGRGNVVYRRYDGHYGMITPE